MVTAQLEKLADCISECVPLFMAHYGEISQHRKHGFELKPNYDKYLRGEDAGEFVFVTLREKGGICGYLGCWIAEESHYMGCMSLQMDLIYVAADSRGMKGGKMLCQTLEGEARRRGFHNWKMGYKEEHARFMEPLLEELGFAPFERTRIKWLV